MKKIISLVLLLFIAGCEKDFDNVVDPAAGRFFITSLNSFTSFQYVVGDSVITLSIGFSSSDDISAVYFDMYSSAGKKLNPSPVQMFDSGLDVHGDIEKNDNIYANKFSLSRNYPNGIYEIKYFVSTRNGAFSQVALHQFRYDNSQDNTPPVVSDLIAPDSIALSDTSVVPITVSVLATDENGEDDIVMVFFNSFLPNGNPSSGNPFILTNDGTGRYSLTVGLPTSATKGTYRWEFQARDRANQLSNKIIHNLVVY